jgi:hypothetical protein
VAWGLLLGLALAEPSCGGDAAARKIAYLQRGDTYYTAANYAAVIEFMNTLQVDPQSVQTRCYLRAEPSQRHIFFVHQADRSNGIFFT